VLHFLHAGCNGLKRRIPLIKTDEEMYIGIGVGRMRIERDWSQEKLADLSELSYRAVQNIEYNATSPSGTSICRLAKAFDMEPWEFLKNISDEIIYKPRKRKAKKKKRTK
jgi:transcriptional regulator with XRE-family HTH domain